MWSHNFDVLKRMAQGITTDLVPRTPDSDTFHLFDRKLPVEDISGCQRKKLNTAEHDIHWTSASGHTAFTVLLKKNIFVTKCYFKNIIIRNWWLTRCNFWFIYLYPINYIRTISGAVNTVKCYWWWAKTSPRTYRADWVQINKPKDAYCWSPITNNTNDARAHEHQNWKTSLKIIC